MSGRGDGLDNELGAFRVFAQIVAAGSLSEAARRMEMSLAFVSRRLSNLEDRLGTRLIDRSSRKFMLTDEGALFHDRVAAILEATDTAVTELHALRGRVEGSLRLSAPNEIGRRRVAALCSRFSEQYPEVTMELALTDVRSDVLRGGIDVALVTKRPTDGDIIQRKLATSRRVMCAAPTYLDQQGWPSTPADLADHRCIVLRRGLVLYDRWTVQVDGKVVEVVVSSALVANSTDVIHDWVLDGGGIAVKAHWDIETDLKDGKLVEVLPGYNVDQVSLYAVYATRRHTPLRIRNFIDFLSHTLNRE